MYPGAPPVGQLNTCTKQHCEEQTLQINVSSIGRLNTYASPASSKAVANDLRNVVFSTGVTSHSESQRSTVDLLTCITANSLLDVARDKRVLYTCNRIGDCLGKALKILDSLF